MATIPELPFEDDPKPANINLYGLQDEDTDIAFNLETAIHNMVPTAAELSVSGALQSYINTSLETTGICQLPPGTITIPSDEKITLRRINGGIIRGTGHAFGTSTGGSQWNNPVNGIAAFTRIRKTGGTSELLELLGVNNLTLEQFTLENPGNIAITYTTDTDGYTSNYLRLNRVGGQDSRIFFDAFGTSNGADVVFNGCNVSRCDVVLRLDNLQAVNYLFQGQCWFGHIEIVALIKRGGYVHLDNCCGFDIKTWVRADSGGSNLMPTCRITNLYSDRTPPEDPPVFIDFSRATGPVGAIVDGVRITNGSTGSDGINVDYINSGHPLFIAPTGTYAYSLWNQPSGTFQGGLVIRDLDLMTFNRQYFVSTPVRQANPYGDQGF